MMTSLSRTQFSVGCTIFQAINGLVCIKNYLIENLRRKRMYPRPDLHAEGSPEFHSHQLHEFIVTLSSGEPMYILAANSIDAAYSALELSEDRHNKLINVRFTDEW